MSSDLDLELTPLTGDPGVVAELQLVLESRPDYHERVNGSPAGPDEAQCVFSALPDGLPADRKYVFGVYRDGAMIGCIDLLVGYPDAHTAMLGLLLVASSAAGNGVGSGALRLLEDWIRQNSDCDRIRLGVVRTNDGVLGFWRRMGFIENGEIRPYAHGPLTSEIVVMAKEL